MPVTVGGRAKTLGVARMGASRSVATGFMCASLVAVGRGEMCHDKLPAWVWNSFCRGLNPIFMDPGNSSKAFRGNWEPTRRALGNTRAYAERMEQVMAES